MCHKEKVTVLRAKYKFIFQTIFYNIIKRKVSSFTNNFYECGSAIHEKTMKKITLLSVLPFLLLTGCNKSTRIEVSASEWKDEAQNKIEKVNEAVSAKNYPFTKYTMVGTDGYGASEKEINGEYTYTTGNWFTDWDFQYKGESDFPTQLAQYELYIAVQYYNEIQNYIGKSDNSFKFYKDGNNLVVEAKYTHSSSDKRDESLTFNENGYVVSIMSRSNEQLSLDLKFTYSK